MSWGNVSDGAEYAWRRVSELQLEHNKAREEWDSMRRALQARNTELVQENRALRSPTTYTGTVTITEREYKELRGRIFELEAIVSGMDEIRKTALAVTP